MSKHPGTPTFAITPRKSFRGLASKLGVGSKKFGEMKQWGHILYPHAKCGSDRLISRLVFPPPKWPILYRVGR